ncbi:MAG: type III polyketide synthase [Planctomycetota bacterium]
MSVRVLGLGVALPPHVTDQQAALDLAQHLAPKDAETRRALAALYRRAGVQQRATILNPLDGAPLRAAAGADLPPDTAERMRLYEQHLPELACRAAARALHESGLPPERIGHVVSVSCTGASAPGLDLALLRGLSLLPTTQRLHVGFMGCHGALAGLRAARALAESQPGVPVLLCAAELCSVHFHYGNDPQQLVANALFADGAGALVAVAGPAPTTAAATGTATTGAGWQLVASGCCLLPNCADAMSWTIGPSGFRMSLSPAVPDLIGQHLRPWLEHFLDAAGLGLGDVRSWAVHPGGPRILAAVEESLDLGPQALSVSRAVLAEHGNMSSPTVFFLWERLRAANAPRPCLSLAFGPGLVVEAALFQ